MYKIKIVTVGKTKETGLSEAIEEYTSRLKTSMTFEWIFVKDDEKLKQFLDKEASYLCLDPNGTLLTSEAFSIYIVNSLKELGSRLTLVIGGSDGIPFEIKAKARKLISLSPLTFTHQLTRLILIEQLYRALEIEKGSAYHK
ncbi:MAG: 23S rRNA (pseudouridine(1915)-N(3))-methyltransferase RlmH [Rhabdochlamydiaceae bacterium]|nr:23S rRNA (pseudouridine(1915)-N(3))-methyltransferase RlmH [Rhabdochlamydiaceae bacterium]